MAVPDASASLRLAREADVPRMRELIDAAYRKYLPRMDRPPAPMLRDMTPEVRAGHAWVTGVPIRALLCLEPDGDALLVGNLAVHPQAQGTGLGRMLMDFAEEQAQSLGLRTLRLYTHEAMTENQAIYAHLGYREVDRRTDDGYRRVFMEKRI